MAKSLAVWIGKSNDTPAKTRTNNESVSEAEEAEAEAEAEAATMEADAFQSNATVRGLELHFNYWVLNDKNLNRKKPLPQDNTWLGPFKIIFWQSTFYVFFLNG